VATVCAAPIGAWMGELWGWRSAFLAAAVLSTLTFAAQCVALPSLPPRDRPDLRVLADLLGRPGVRVALLAVLLVISGHFAGFTYIRPLMEQVTHASVQMVSLRIGFSNAIGRPKNGPENAPGRARRGPKYATLGGFSAQSGRLQARGWRVGRSLNVHGTQDWTRVSGLTLMLAMDCRHGAQWGATGGGRVPAARSDWYPTAQAAQAAKCSPASRTRPLDGGCGSNPRCARIFSITGRSRMAAMILSELVPEKWTSRSL
jgi:MFS family permease